MHRRAFSVGLLSLLWIGIASPIAHAQLASTSPSTRTLTALYSEALKRKEKDTYIEKRIDDERAKVRAEAEKEIASLTEANAVESTDAALLPKAVDRQRAVVAGLQELLREKKVDRDLLLEEEKRFYVGTLFGTGATDTLRTTSSYAELLALKAVSEERIGALESAIALQNDRLSKLSAQQWIDQFTGIFQILSYVLILVLGIVVDRVVRRRIVRRIDDRERRYRVAKGLSAAIYGMTILIVIARILRDHPDAVASFAIIGAGIAIALQDVIRDVVSWAIVLQRRLYRVGDRISIGAYTGDVVDIGLLRTTIMEVTKPIVQAAATVLPPAHEQTGTLITIPNSLLLREAVAHHATAAGFVIADLSFTIAHTHAWPAIHAMLQEILDRETKKYSDQAQKQQRRRTSIYYGSWEAIEPTVHATLSGVGIMVSLVFLAPLGQRKEVQTRVSEAILARLTDAYEITTKENAMILHPRR